MTQIIVKSHECHGISNHLLFVQYLVRLSTKKHQSTALLALCEVIHRWSLDSLTKGSIIRKACPCHDVIIRCAGSFNTLRPRQNGRHFADDIFKYIFLNENVWIPIRISLKFVPKGPINNIPSLVQIMAWRRPGDKPLSETMMLDNRRICVTRPQCVI